MHRSCVSGQQIDFVDLVSKMFALQFNGHNHLTSASVKLDVLGMCYFNKGLPNLTLQLRLIFWLRYDLPIRLMSCS